MTATEIINLAKKMRNAQKTYFRTRLRADLNESKSLERQFDKAVEEYERNNPQLLIDIFSDYEDSMQDL